MSRDVPNSLRLTVALAVVLALIAIWRLLRPGKVRWLPWDAAARQRLALLGGAIPPATGGRRGAGRGRAGRHPVPPLRPRAAGARRPGGRGGRPRLGDLAAARPGAAGGSGSGVLARRARAAEGVWRSGPDRAAARAGRAAAAGNPRRDTGGEPVSGMRGRAGPHDVAAAAAPARRTDQDMVPTAAG